MKSIVFYNDPILTKKAQPVERINSGLKQLIVEMTELMHEASGVGIAAPQVGESIQLAVVDVPEDTGSGGRVILINPKIISAYGSEIREEGCLSIPGVHVKVKRYREVVVETMDMDGRKVTCKAAGLFARAIQHEMDHINGVLIIDKLTTVRRLLAKRKVAKCIPLDRA